MVEVPATAEGLVAVNEGSVMAEESVGGVRVFAGGAIPAAGG